MAESYVLLVNFVLQNDILLPKHTILPPGGCFGAITQKLKQIPPPLGCFGANYAPKYMLTKLETLHLWNS